MKLKSLLTLLAVCILCLMQSCTSDQEPMTSSVNGSETSISHMVVKFEGKVYETDVRTVGDSVTYLNKEYAAIYASKILNLPNLATVVTTENGVTFVEYLASQEEVTKKYRLIGFNTDSESLYGTYTRSKLIDLKYKDGSATILGTGELYDDKNFKDTQLKCYLTARGASSCNWLKNHGFNDKCSSIKVYNNMKLGSTYEVWDDTKYIGTYPASQLRPVLVGFENSDFNIINGYYYSGKVLYCIAPETQNALTNNPQVHSDNNLKTIGWNDKISSVSWLLATHPDAFASINGEDPEIPAHPDC